MFTLDTSTLSGEGNVRTRVRTGGFARWFQIRFRQSSARAVTLLGFLLTLVSAGERRGDS